MKIRIAAAEDVRRIAEIQVDSWRSAYRGILPDAYLDRLDVESRLAVWRQFVGKSESPILVADEEKTLVGFCHLMPSRDTDADNEAEIVAIYLDPPAWRRGIGRGLCAAALAIACEQGYRAMTIWVLEENRRARGFYEAMGLATDGGTKLARIGGQEFGEIRYRKALC